MEKSAFTAACLSDSNGQRGQAKPVLRRALCRIGGDVPPCKVDSDSGESRCNFSSGVSAGKLQLEHLELPLARLSFSEYVALSVFILVFVCPVDTGISCLFAAVGAENEVAGFDCNGALQRSISVSCLYNRPETSCSIYRDDNAGISVVDVAAQVEAAAPANFCRWHAGCDAGRNGLSCSDSNRGSFHFRLYLVSGKIRIGRSIAFAD